MPGDDGVVRGKAVQDRGRGRGKGKKAGGGSVLPRRNDVSLGRNPGVVAGRMNSGGLGVALPCASAERSHLLPQVFGDWSYAGCMLSSHVRAQHLDWKSYCQRAKRRTSQLARRAIFM